MRITYDKAADAVYINFVAIKPGEVKKTFSCDPHRAGEINLDFAESGTLLGIEILAANRKLPSNFFVDNKIEYL